MSLALKFVNILKTCLSIGAATVPSILNTLSPGWGCLVSTILSAVLNAEAAIGSGKGEQKSVVALNAVQAAIPALVALMEKTTGHNLRDEDLFAEGIGEMQEGVVKVLNSFAVLPKTISITKAAA